MSYLSFTKGRPIGIIKGGKLNNKTIYLTEEKICDKCTEDKQCKECKKNGGCNICKPRKRFKMDEDDPMKVFQEEMDNLLNDVTKEITIDDGGIVTPLPFIKDEYRENLFISGPEGAGKSHFAGQYIEQYKKAFPDNPIYIFSKITKDKALDKHDPIRIKLDEDLIDNPLTPEDLGDSLVIFDDIETIRDKKLKQTVALLRDELLEVGRHNMVYVLSLNHNPTNGKETKTSLSESNGITLFPKGGDEHHIKYCLSKYGGMSAKQIDDVLDLKSRWMTLYKRYPKYVLHSKGAYLLK